MILSLSVFNNLISKLEIRRWNLFNLLMIIIIYYISESSSFKIWIC